jgi:polyhydroxybutyrate depolymerase
MRNDIDDVGFVVAVLDDLATDLRVDRRRVYATGLSNGGMMSYRLACDAADRFAAVAPVAATLIATDCEPTEPISLLHIHGLADGNVPFDGGLPTKHRQPNPPEYPPVRDGLDLFVRAEGCDTNPRTEQDGPVTTERWTSCSNRTAVELITIDGAGHSWPGGERMAAILDEPSDALDATSVIWQFFAAHPRAT